MCYILKRVLTYTAETRPETSSGAPIVENSWSEDTEEKQLGEIASVITKSLDENVTQLRWDSIETSGMEQPNRENGSKNEDERIMRDTAAQSIAGQGRDGDTVVDHTGRQKSLVNEKKLKFYFVKSVLNAIPFKYVLLCESLQ